MRRFFRFLASLFVNRSKSLEAAAAELPEGWTLMYNLVDDQAELILFDTTGKEFEVTLSGDLAADLQSAVNEAYYLQDQADRGRNNFFGYAV